MPELIPLNKIFIEKEPHFLEKKVLKRLQNM